MNRVFLILFLHFFLNCRAQESGNKNWELNGYIKDLNPVSFGNDFREVSYTNLLHNRINFKWKPSEKITGVIEVRNRFFWGDEVSKNPYFGQLLKNNNEAVNLSFKWKTTSNSIFHSNPERLSVEFRKPKWNLRAGRQRINWGMANIWNPNDIFNTYNFLDFDYEEKPGCDALKFQYSITDLSNLEVAASMTKGKDKTIGAIKYFMNYHGYDLQLISGVFHNSFTAGFGWAGSIGKMGYKGESQFFLHPKDSGNYLNLAMEVDYFFKNGWYVNSAFLYNNKGINSPENRWSEFNFNTSPTDLMPAKWNILLGYTKEFTPLFSGGMNVVVCPGANLLILFPSFRYNLISNLDLDFVWQSLFGEWNHRFQGIAHTGFLRFKWNF